jgi:hypothetical protein
LTFSFCLDPREESILKQLQNFIETYFTGVSIFAIFLGARNYRSGDRKAHKWNDFLTHATVFHRVEKKK